MSAPYIIAFDRRNTGIESCTYCSCDSVVPIAAPDPALTSSSENLAPSAWRSDSGPNPTTVLLTPFSIRVLRTSAPRPLHQKLTAPSMSLTGTVSLCMNCAFPSCRSARSCCVKASFFWSCRISYSSCAFSPNTYGSSGLSSYLRRTSESRTSFSAMAPVGTTVYAASAGRDVVRPMSASPAGKSVRSKALRVTRASPLTFGGTRISV
mmetsp:Transcript_5339/g.11750  ORF Transcript_5339/g.11750 Transcript_5339/m.11750 type:complete len:208 (+) Transcript_5339:519-1142(+)